MRESGWLDVRLYDDVFLLSHILCVICHDLTETEKEKLKNKFLKDECRKMSKWIPVSERLPEDDGWYLCTIQNETETKVAQIRFFESTKWKAYGWNVIAWMNEPQPYKAESEG